MNSVGILEDASRRLKVEFREVNAVPVVVQHQAPGVLEHGAQAVGVFQRHVIAPVHDGRLAAGRHFAPLGVPLPELLADHRIFQPGIDGDALEMRRLEEAASELVKHLRVVKGGEMDFADRPTLQLGSHRDGIKLIAHVEINAQVVRRQRGSDAQFVHDRLRQERQVFVNHPLGRLERNGAVNKPPLPTAARDHQRPSAFQVVSQHLKRGVLLEARVRQRAGQPEGVFGIAFPTILGYLPTGSGGLESKFCGQRRGAIQQQGHAALEIPKDGLEQSRVELPALRLRNNQKNVLVPRRRQVVLQPRPPAGGTRCSKARE